MYTVHLGLSGFPRSDATMQRIRLTFKALKLKGIKTLILNKFSLTKVENPKRIGTYDGLIYVNLPGSLSRPDSFLKRSLNKLSGYISEIVFLFKRRKSIGTAIYYGQSFWELLYYSFLTRIFNIKMVVQYVEYRSSFNFKVEFYAKWDFYLFDNYSFFYCDGLIVISEFLKDRALAKRPSIPIIKIPAITDFSDFDVAPNNEHKNYLLYCGTIGHLPLISFILDLFEKIKDNNIYDGDLMLVIGGDDAGIFKDLDTQLKNNKYSQNIIFKKNVAHKNIPALYVGADLLLIPMRRTLQDSARFPHKVSEYTASRVAMLSTNTGEVGYYFKNGESAILAEEYDVGDYYNVVSQFLRSMDELKRIGENGYRVGMKNFNYLAYSDRLENFLTKL